MASLESLIAGHEEPARLEELIGDYAAAAEPEELEDDWEGHPGVLCSLYRATTGEGEVLDLGRLRSHHTIQVNPSRGVASGVVVLEGSLDAARWHPIARVVIEGGRNVFFAGTPRATTGNTPVAFCYLRASIEEDVTGGTVDVYIGG